MTRRGFTLIEVLIALALTVIVASALASSLWVAFKARRSANAAIEESRQTSTTGDVLAREIAGCLPPTGRLAGPFEGVADDIQFFTTGPEPKATVQGDIRGIEYTTVPGTNNGQNLVRRVTSNLLAQVVVTPPDEVLCQNVDSLEFWYYDGTDWQDSWDSTTASPANTLPVAVKFTLTLLPASPGAQPQTTTRIIALSCYKPQNQTAPTATPSGGATP